MSYPHGHRYPEHMARVLLMLVIVSGLIAGSGAQVLAEPASWPAFVELATGGMAVRGEFYAPDRSVAGAGRTTAVAGTPAIRRIVDQRPGDPLAVAAQLTVELGTPVYPNVVGHLAQTSEPSYRDQWALENTGLAGGTVDADVDAEDAWHYSTGDASIVVAIIDSGVDASHPDLAPRLWENAGEIPGNGLDDDGNLYIDDTYGWDFVGKDPVPDDDVDHGTGVAAIVAADVNGVGITGVAPRTRIMPLRSCFPDGLGDSFCSAADVIDAVFYAIDNGASVINLSLGFDGGPVLGLELALAEARAAGIIVVAAAGNFGSTLVLYPASSGLDNVVSVASTDRYDDLSSFSSFSTTLVDIGAPGEEILTAAVVLPGFDDYVVVDGTSFSAPHVSGTAALMLSVNPALTPAQIIDLLKVYGDRRPALASTTVAGTRLNAGQAVFAARLLDIHDSIFRDNIVWLARREITRGCNPPDNNRFCPDDPVTRGEMAAFLVRALGLTEGAGSDTFSDDDDSVFQADIERLAAAGITKGCNPPDNDLFCPDHVVTREQMAAFLVRALGHTDASGGGFLDVALDSVFLADINRLATAGITRGCNPPANTQFCPADVVTRGQMAAFLHRALK